jgi:chromosome segregation ATPase
MNSANLISGFEDVITHIRQQEFLIKELEAHKKQSAYENKKLKEENKELKEDIQIHKDTLEEHFVHYDNLKQEKNELVQTILSLKSCVVDLREARDMREQKIKELKEENEELKLMLDRLPNDMDHTWWCKKNKRWRWNNDDYESESESESEEEDQECFSCEKVMNKKTEYENCDTSSLVYTAYKWYLGSEHDCGACCEECVVNIYQEES